MSFKEEKSHSPHHHGRTLKILTYNIFIRIIRCSASGIGDCKTERLRAFAKHVLPKFDIVCLQEMFGRPTVLTMGRRDFLIRSAKKCGFKYVLTSPYPKYWRGKFLDGGVFDSFRNWTSHTHITHIYTHITHIYRIGDLVEISFRGNEQNRVRRWNR